MNLASGHGHDASQGERETNILFEIPSKDSRSEPGQPPIGKGGSSAVRSQARSGCTSGSARPRLRRSGPGGPSQRQH